MENMKRKIAIIVLTVIILTVFITLICCINVNTELKTIKSEKQLEKMYSGRDDDSILKKAILGPLVLPYEISRNIYVEEDYIITEDITSATDSESIFKNIQTNEQSSNSITNKDYSKTNIQVENVDEADIIKTDGNYIYSLSKESIVITDVTDPNKIKVASKITPTDNGIPEDLILFENKLVAICSEINSPYIYYSSNKNNTIVRIYDITNREEPRMVKNYKLYEPYYTTRCIGSKLYVISTGNLRKENNKIVRYYDEEYSQKEIELKNIKYLKNVETNKQTIISMMDLNNIEQNVNVSSYLIDIENAYISEKNIYLLDTNYKGNYYPKISSIYGIKGIWGLNDYIYDYTRNYETEIYKFNILDNGEVEYSCKTRVKGQTINQYSLDEYNGNLRVALKDSREGSRIVIFNEKMQQIGETPYLAKGEQMYSSRFMGDKAYLVTYKTIDPLFVIDLSNPTEPKVLGELKIPGYSTYLHPYDENHLIGIGMQTEEKINRDIQGKVTSATATITGMKMALFDVTDPTNPVEISSTVIGDRRTTSAILTNPKALLFSKEKELIAIPVNNYAEYISIASSNTYEDTINAYKKNTTKYISEGYSVYSINIEKGINLKGIITQENIDNKSQDTYYYTNSKLLRGVYIENNLYTVSEKCIKVSDLETLKEISKIDL
jgi:inhibitor of cysteine peptidase